MRAWMIITMVLALGVVSCASGNQQRGAAAGAAIGAGSGAIIGNQFGPRGAEQGALMGAAVGGAIGLMYGQKEDEIQMMQNGNGHQRPQQTPVYPRGNMGAQQTQGGDVLSNPYRAPDAANCQGQWQWDPYARYWICR